MLWNVLSVKSPNSRAQAPETSRLACLSAWQFSEGWKRSRVGLHILTGRMCLCLVSCDLSPMKRTIICRAPPPPTSNPPPPTPPIMSAFTQPGCMVRPTGRNFSAAESQNSISVPQELSTAFSLLLSDSQSPS